MKFIHTADLHLDSKIDSLPTDKAKIRREEVISSFERLCDYALKNDITAVIVAGDMFDSAKISSKTMLRIFNSILKAKNTDFLCLSGNHDEQNLFYTAENLPQNLKFFSNCWTKFNYDNICISGISFDNKNILTYTDSLSLDENNLNIVCLHGQIVGYNSNGDGEIIALPKLKNKFIDYLALGHIHQRVFESLDLRGKYSYSGCLEGRGFDEIGVKGFNLINIENNKINTEFIEFSSRAFYVENFAFDNTQNFYTQVDDFLSLLKQKYTSNDILKVEVTGEILSDSELDFDALSSKFNESFFFVKVVDKTTLKIDAKDFENDKSIIGEFVRTVLSSDLTKEEQEKVILMGLNALNDKEI